MDSDRSIGFSFGNRDSSVRNTDTSSCVQRAVTHHGVTAEQLTDAWMKGGSAFQDLILGIPEVAATLHGEYLKRRGGFPGKAISVRPGDPDFDEKLPPVPGEPRGAHCMPFPTAIDRDRSYSVN
jgi:hypothetical protein